MYILRLLCDFCFSGLKALQVAIFKEEANV